MPEIRAVQCVQATDIGPDAGLTTAAITTTPGNLLVVLIYCFGNNIGATPVTDSKSNTWTAAIASTGTTEGFGAMFYAENCLGGASHTFTFTPGAADFLSMSVFEIVGAATSGALSDTAAQTQSGGTRVSGTITAQGTYPELFIGGTGPQRVAQGVPSLTAVNWFLATPLAATSTQAGYFSAFRYVAAGTTDELSLTMPAGNNTTVMAAGFIAASVGGGGGFDAQQRVVGSGLIG